MSSPALKAKKSVYDILKCLRAVQCFDLNIFSTLFSSKIQPILLYGSEVWGVHESKQMERVHTFAYKRFLNVSVHSSNKMLYGEVGRYPISIICKVNVIRYWLKLIKLPSWLWPPFWIFPLYIDLQFSRVCIFEV